MFQTYYLAQYNAESGQSQYLDTLGNGSYYPQN